MLLKKLDQKSMSVVHVMLERSEASCPVPVMIFSPLRRSLCSRFEIFPPCSRQEI